MATKDELEFVAAMARIAREDREIYRQLRAEAWALVQRNHASKNEEQRVAWERAAS